MKKPDEIKNGLECAITEKCIKDDCPYFKPEIPQINPLDLDYSEYEKNYSCIEKNRIDAFRYIQLLENQVLDLTKKIEAQSGASKKFEEANDAQKRSD